MKIAYLFRGQGAQFRGMAKELENKWFMRVAGEVLNLDLLRLCLEGSEEELKRPSIAQPAILAVSFSLFHQQRRAPDVVAGHSLGEYTALCAAGSIDFRDAVGLVSSRGLFMEEADCGKGGMLAVVGQELSFVKELCEREKIEIANFNSPNQLVLSGGKERLIWVSRFLSGKKEIRTKLLEVAGACHSKAMIPAREKLKLVIGNTHFREPFIPVIFNVTADYERDPDKIKELLVRQLVEPVLWEQQIRRMINDGVEEFVEIWPKKIFEPFVKAVKKELG